MPMSAVRDSRYDVIVIGGGAMGSAATWQLARSGRSVLLLDRYGAGHAYGASHGEVRIFRYGYVDPRYVRMAQAALRRWRELEADSGQSLIELTGALDHGPEADIEDLAVAYRECGVAHERITPDEASQRWPGMRFDTTVLLQTEAGWIRAAATLQALHRAAARHGADVRWNERVLEIKAGADVVRLRTDSDGFEAPVVVVAAGAWTEQVLGSTGISLPILSNTQEQIFHFPPNPAIRSLPGDNLWPPFMHRGPQIWYGLETPGEGIKLGEHHGGIPCDPDARSFVVDPGARERACEYAARWLPGVDPEPVSETTCLYTTTPTEDFVIERYGRIVVAAGFSGHGFKFTPLVGARLAELATG